VKQKWVEKEETNRE